MKTLTFSAILCALLLQTDLTAQVLGSSSTSKLKIGLVAGYNRATLNDQILPIFEVDELDGLHFGLSTDLRLTKRFSLEPTFLVSQKGFKAITNGQTPQTHKLDYLSLQLIFKVLVTKGVNILLGTEGSLLNSFESINMDSFDQVTFNKGDYSFLAGIEVSVLKQLSLHAKFNTSFLGVIDYKHTDVSGQALGESFYKNRLVMIGATYYPFRFGEN